MMFQSLLEMNIWSVNKKKYFSIYQFGWKHLLRMADTFMKFWEKVFSIDALLIIVKISTKIWKFHFPVDSRSIFSSVISNFECTVGTTNSQYKMGQIRCRWHITSGQLKSKWEQLKRRYRIPSGTIKLSTACHSDLFRI